MSSKVLRSFLKDFLDPKIKLKDLSVKWSGNGSLYKSLVDFKDSLPLFGIDYNIDWSDDPYIFIFLKDKVRQLKYHDNLGVYIYEDGSLIV